MMLRSWKWMTPNFKVKNVRFLQTDLCPLTTRLTVNVTFDRTTTQTSTGAAALTGHVIHVPPVRETKRDKQDEKQMLDMTSCATFWVRAAVFLLLYCIEIEMRLLDHRFLEYQSANYRWQITPFRHSLLVELWSSEIAFLFIILKFGPFCKLKLLRTFVRKQSSLYTFSNARARICAKYDQRNNSVHNKE